MMKIIFNALMVLRGWFNTLACCQLLDSGFNQWLWWRWPRLNCREDDSAFWLVVDYDSDRELLCQRGHRCGQSNSINWLLMRRGGLEWWWFILVIMTKWWWGRYWLWIWRIILYPSDNCYRQIIPLRLTQSKTCRKRQELVAGLFIKFTLQPLIL